MAVTHSLCVLPHERERERMGGDGFERGGLWLVGGGDIVLV